MPQPPDTLWDSEPRTLIKHKVYRSYLGCWMAKICQRFPYATIIDAFAGPGQYRDGPEGSPLVIARTFLDHKFLSNFKTLRLVCLEKRPDRHEHLRRRLNTLPQRPNLQRIVPAPGEAAASLPMLRAAAHPPRADGPALWVLDPFNPGGIPFDLVRQCLASPRDEVLITWFADEIYRFCEDPTKADALTRHFGGTHWRQALKTCGESARKRALLTAYESGLQSLPGVHTQAFSISSKNETARYSLILATHSTKGLECFNPVKWRLDPVLGQHINEFRGEQQPSLFDDMPDLTRLLDHLRTLAGQARTFKQLAKDATKLGYLEKHLRSALDELAQPGLAVREHPLIDEARTPWPDTSLIRFYPAVP